MRAVAVVTSLALFTSACFPNNPRRQTIAKIAEGGVLLGGIGLLAVVNSGADCMSTIPGMPEKDCESRASLLSNVGLALVLTGLIGFIVTVSTSPDDKPTSPPTTAPTATPPTPAEPAPATAPVAPMDPPVEPTAPAEPIPTP